MKRPMLISGITMTVICALLTSLSECAPVVVPIAASVFLICQILKKRGTDTLLISYICIIIIIAAASFLIFTAAKIKPCAEVHNTETFIQGKIIDIPDYSDDSCTFTLKTDKIGTRKESQKIAVTLSVISDYTPRLYDYVYLKNAVLKIPKDSKNNFDFSSAADGIIVYAESTNITKIGEYRRTPYYYCLTLKQKILDRISVSVESNNAGLLSGMLFGDTDDINNQTKQDFRNSGIAHLLAVSGLHTSLWCGMLLTVLKLLRIREKANVPVCMTFLVLFCIISSFTPSVIRASLMTACSLCAPLVKRRADPFNSLGLAVTLLLITNPYTVLSISFQLSAAATTGVLLSTCFTDFCFRLCNKIPLRRLRGFVLYLLTSFMVSIFSGLSTLPVSAYHFGVSSLLSPVANILCVKPAFYGMIAGTLATAISFIPLMPFKAISFALFDISEAILNIVCLLSNAVSKNPVCTVAVHKEWLLNGLVIAAIVLFAGFLIYKIKKSKFMLKLTAALSVAGLLISIAVPLTVPQYKNTITILSAGNNIHLIIRSGTKYAYIVNSNSGTPAALYDYLPKSTSESLDIFAATYLTNANIHGLYTVKNRYSPAETRITPAIKSICTKREISLPENTFIKTVGLYRLSDEITFEIIDTYPVQYVIIKSNRKTAVVHLHGKAEISSVQNTEDADIFVFNGSVPEYIQSGLETIVISSETDLITERNTKYLEKQCNNLYFTSRDGDIQLNL